MLNPPLMASVRDRSKSDKSGPVAERPMGPRGNPEPIGHQENYLYIYIYTLYGKSISKIFSGDVPASNGSDNTKG
jgi:hypothetical protein